jgi:hypothetical protein
MRNSYFSENLMSMLSPDSNIERIIDFLKRKGLLKTTMSCSTCNTQMIWSKCSAIKDKFRWKCMKKECELNKTTISIRKDSIFDDVRCDLRSIVFVMYLWSRETPIKRAYEDTGLSRPTISLIYGFMRDICKRYFDPIKLGGEGIICQVDESLFSYKPKYHRGRAPEEERWVFGIVDTSYTPARGYMQCVERRNSATLLPIIQKVCLPGTMIYSDGWAAYPAIQEIGYEFSSVNHKENHVDPVTGTHTQNVESYWNKQKFRIKK